MDAGPGTLLLLLSTVLGSLAEKEQNCTAHEFDECFTTLLAIAQSEDLSLPTSREELNLVCRKLQQGVRCAEDHSFRCFTITEKRVFNSVVSESRHVIDDLCVPGKLQEDYLRYAPCFKNVSTDDRKCAGKYRRLVETQGLELEDDNQQLDANDRLKRYCCVFTEFVQCQYKHLKRECGSQVDQFFQSHMERMSGSLINEHCAIYTHGSDACAFNEGSSRNTMCTGFVTVCASVLFVCSLNLILLLIQR